MLQTLVDKALADNPAVRASATLSNWSGIEKVDTKNVLIE